MDVLLYGNDNETSLKKLHILQSSALRISLGVMKTTPAESLNVESL